MQLLTDIRDTQRESVARQREHVDIARAEAERMRRTAEESVALQRSAVERARNIGRIVLPLILALMGLVVWLIVKYRIL